MVNLLTIVYQYDYFYVSFALFVSFVLLAVKRRSTKADYKKKISLFYL